MPKFKKKPVVVEAQLLTIDTVEQVAEWCGGNIKGTKLSVEKQHIVIGTLEGEMVAEMGTWVIKGIQGEFYPCKADIFEKTYELVSYLDSER